MIPPSPQPTLLLEVERLHDRIRQLETREAQRLGRVRSIKKGVVAVLALTVSSVAYAQLTTFVANGPALASEVNGNFTQLKTWLEQKVGTAGSAEVRVQTGATSSASTAAGKALFVSAVTGTGAQPILEVRHDNLTQGIALGFNTISAVSTAANLDLNLQGKGTGAVTFPGLVDIGLQRISCSGVASGTVCDCPAGKRVLGGGSYCSGNNEHVNTSFPNSDTSWQAWCEDSAGTNQAVDIYVLCARVR